MVGQMRDDKHNQFESKIDQKVAPAASLFGLANEFSIGWYSIISFSICQMSTYLGQGNFLATVLLQLPLDRCGIFAKPEKGQ